MPLPWHLRSHALGSRQHTNARLISGAFAETLPRHVSKTNATALTSSRESLALIELSAGLSLSTITFWTATTAWTPGTHQWFSLRDSAGLLLATTADDGLTAWGSNAAKTLYISRGVTDAVATNASAVITSATIAFTASDVGKQVTFMGAGAAGIPLGTTLARVTIASVQSATSATLSATASTTVGSGGTLYVATPYTTTTNATYYLGQFVDGTVPTHWTTTESSTVIMAASPVLCGKDTTNTGMTTPLTAVSSSGALANGNATLPYAYVS